MHYGLFVNLLFGIVLSWAPRKCIAVGNISKHIVSQLSHSICNCMINVNRLNWCQVPCNECRVPFLGNKMLEIWIDLWCFLQSKEAAHMFWPRWVSIPVLLFYAFRIFHLSLQNTTRFFSSRIFKNNCKNLLLNLTLQNRLKPKAFAVRMDG